ncbi:MAG: hypothetical protein A2020_09770 [Lentisphaerae bacterium GWF2_45_14]|nr:MAG: hypothetical protein A2020_09770 [Lentisphaerae bacterium GWF2_45_14]
MNVLINYMPGHAGPKIMRGFVRAFRTLGHTVTELPAGEKLMDSYELIMGYSGSSIIKLGESAFTLAQFYNSRVAQYWADDIDDLSKVSRTGLILQSDLGCSEKWKAAGIKNTYLPLATDEKIFHPLDVEKIYDVVLTGIVSPPRMEVLRQLAGLNVAVFGPWEHGWKDYPESASLYKGCLDTEEELNLLYNQSRICIDASSPQNLNSANFTVFNAMASGCVLITNEKPALDLLFGEAKPPVFKEDCREVVMKYLDNSMLAREEALRQSGIILKGHTFIHRANTVLDKVQKTGKLALPPEIASEVKRIMSGKK